MADLSDIANRELPPKNHNNPPSETEWLGENLTLRHVHIIRAAEGHLAIADNIPAQFTAENEAEYITGFIKLMTNCQKELERRRKEEKEPFLRQGQYVDSFFGDIYEKLANAIVKANRPLSDWLQRKAHAEQEQRNREAEQLRKDQQHALASAATISAGPNPNSEQITAAVDTAVNLTHAVHVAETVAAAPITSMASVATKSGTAGLQTKWVGTIKNVEQLDLHKLRPYLAAAELQKALDRFVKQGGRTCEGAEIKETMDVKVK